MARVLAGQEVLSGSFSAHACSTTIYLTPLTAGA